MKKVIIHISDLHVSLHQDLKKRPIKDIKSHLTTDNQDVLVNQYIAQFCKYVIEKFPDCAFYLLITGDIANIAEEQEFNTALNLLETMITELKVDKKNVLIIPGDHDVNREDNKNAFKIGNESDSIKKSYEYESEKFSKFGIFYNSFLNENFEYAKSIVKYIEIQPENLLLVGINSNHFVDYEGGLGAVDITKLNSELEEINKKFTKHSKIAIFHHNIFSGYENKITGQWEPTNRLSVIQALEKYEYKLILNGNEHTRGSQKSSNHNLYYSDSGSFSYNPPSPSFKIYEIVKDDTSLMLKNNLFILQRAGKIDVEFPFGSWGVQDNKDMSELNTFQLVEKANVEIVENINLDKILEANEQNQILKEETARLTRYENTFYKDQLMKLIKEKKLFHSGHFHWSETSRAHNWIDVSKILNDNEDLFQAKEAIVDVIKNCNLEDTFDFIIGLGNEGTILSTRTSVKYNKPFSYLPYSYRYDEHSSYEQKLNFENNGDYKTVLIITDVVHDGRTLRKLINKREKEFFKNVERIIVISLFYTGLNTSGETDIINSSKLELFDLSTDHKEERIEYYHILQLKVEPCPYGADFRTECLIVNEGLGCVYKFYDEEKALEKLALEGVANSKKETE